MFRTVSPSIIRSLRLYIQHHTIQVLWLLASKQSQNVYDTYLMLYVQFQTPDDGRKDRPKHVELFQSKINYKYCASGWFYYICIFIYITEMSLQSFKGKILTVPVILHRHSVHCLTSAQPVTLSNYSSLNVHITSALSAKIATAIPPVRLTAFVVLSCSCDVQPNLVTCSRHVWHTNRTRLGALSYLRRKVAAVINKYNDRIK